MQSEITSQGRPETPQRPLEIRQIFLTDQAEALDAHGDFAKSIARYKEALAATPNYVRAWHGLAEAEWRSGDAAETITATKEAARRGKNASDWELLARALAANEPRKSVADFVGDLNAVYGDTSTLPVDVILAGLRFFAGDRTDADRVVKIVLSRDGSIDAKTKTELLRDLAWWMNRAGKPEDAAEILQEAHQLLPQESETMLQLAWAYSDVGRQADAVQYIGKINGESSLGAEHHAALAVISVRISQHSQTNDAFQSAASEDPVWMVPRWVDNNFSKSTAAVIKQLQIEELARRKKVADELARQKKEGESRQHSNN